jgi:DNA polymerase-3 subunit epsilon
LKHLKLERPLVVFDLETTGTDPAQDRIVEIAALRVTPDGEREPKRRRINPERAIPAAATAVHGISDADVRDEPTFRMIARSLLDWLSGADLAGFNLLRFDVPLLDREFRDCGLDLELAERNVVDAMTIFHRKEPRDLTAAVRFYLGRDHAGAHAADADVEATYAVLEAQLERYDDLPRTVEELHRWTVSGRGEAVDRGGKFVWQEREVLFAFGKFQGQTLRKVVVEAPDYLRWILDSDFPDDAKQLVEGALRGVYPERRQST